MPFKAPSVFFLVAAIVAIGYYTIEPWAVTFVDDGPYYSAEFPGPIEEIPVLSQVDLRRFGQLVYTLESRLSSAGNESVLVLRNRKGEVIWARLPVKPDGELGPLALRDANVTWYGGWRIAISPENQERGHLYVSSFGGFRFFNHSW